MSQAGRSGGAKSWPLRKTLERASRLGPAPGAYLASGIVPDRQKKLLFCLEPDIAEMLCSGGSSAQEARMVGMRSERARARARHLLAMVYPVPDDVEFQCRRELAIDYLQEAERLDAASRGRAPESEELISAALDAVVRDYFARALARAWSQRRR
jgi:hypothetical protein